MDSDEAMKTSLLAGQRRPLGPPPSSCNDLWAALLFLANLIFISFIAAASDAGTSVYDGRLSQLIVAFTGLGTIALIIGSLWLAFVMRFSSSIITFMLYATTVVFALLAVASLLTGSIFGGLLLGLTAGASHWYLQAVQPRIPFSSAVLSIAVKSISAHFPVFMLVAALMGALSLVWAALWSVATFKLLSRFNGDDNSYLEWTELSFFLVTPFPLNLHHMQ